MGGKRRFIVANMDGPCEGRRHLRADHGVRFHQSWPGGGGKKLLRRRDIQFEGNPPQRGQKIPEILFEALYLRAIVAGRSFALQQYGKWVP